MNTRLLYIADMSIRHPLVQSQVVRYLKRLSADLEACHLITFERDPFTAAEKHETLEQLKQGRITWHPLPATPGSRSRNTLKEINQGFKYGRGLIRSERLNLVHCRSFIPGNIGLKLKRRCKVKFLYDMRGFWADEKRAKGTINNPLLYQFASYLEKRLFNQADALVSLTSAGRDLLQRRGVGAPIEVIPCCVDTELFSPLNRDVDPMTAEQFISVGSLGRGYLAAETIGLFAAAKQRNPGCTLTLVTRDDPASVQHLLDAHQLDDVHFVSASPTEVPSHLAKATVGLCLIEPSFAKIASSPTKLAEYLACGVPVIANCDGIGDLNQLLDENPIGIKIEDYSADGLNLALDQLAERRSTGQLTAQQCRQVAMENFPIELAVERYSKLYRSLLADMSGTDGGKH